MADRLVGATAGMRIHEAPRRLHWNELGNQVKLPINAGNMQELPHISISLGPEDTEIPETFVFLGEGYFTFCTAFAAYRRSWRGIVPTNYYGAYTIDNRRQNSEKSYKNGDVPEDMQQDMKEKWKATIFSNLNNCREWLDNQKKDGENLEDMLNKQASLKSLKDENEDILKKLLNMDAPTRRHLDATNMGTRDDLLGNMEIPKTSAITLWFQCPWQSGTKELDYPNLLLKYMFSSAAGVQKKDELFLVGLCVDPGTEQGKDLVCRYGQVTAAACDAGYKCLGADQQFVGRMLELGYKHHRDTNKNVCLRAITFRITKQEQFATLLFKKCRPASCVYIDGTVWPSNQVHVKRSPDGLGIEIFSNGQSSETLTSDQWLQLKTEINRFFENQEWIAQDRPLDHANRLLKNTEFIVEGGKLIYRLRTNYPLSVISYPEWRNKSSQIDQLFEQQ